MSPIADYNNIYINNQSEASNLTRFWGGLKTLGGVAETIAGGGFALATSWSGIGLAAGGGVAAHGIDTSLSGLKQLISGYENRTYTAKAISNVSGSDKIGDIADAGIGFFGAFGSALAKIGKGFSSIKIPSLWKDTVWKYGKLPSGTLGATDTIGNITIRKGLAGKEFEHVLKHEMFHRALTPKTGIFHKIRAQLGISGYGNSQLLRFTEEALAEAYSGSKLGRSITHPLKNDYDITFGGLAAESTVLAGTLINAGKFGAEIKND